MHTQIQKSVRLLRAVNPNLNQVADDASKVVQELEAILKELDFAIPAEVNVCRTSKSKKVMHYLTLALRRVEGQFRVAVLNEERTEVSRDDGHVDWVWKTESVIPWVDCSRDVKLVTFQKVPCLLDDLLKESQRAAAKALKTLETVQRMASALPHSAE